MSAHVVTMLTNPRPVRNDYSVQAMLQLHSASPGSNSQSPKPLLLTAPVPCGSGASPAHQTMSSRVNPSVQEHHRRHAADPATKVLAAIQTGVSMQLWVWFPIFTDSHSLPNLHAASCTQSKWVTGEADGPLLTASS